MEQNEKLEKMAKEIITFIKRKKMWDSNCGLIFNGKHITFEGEVPREENLAGVMRFWYEGPLARAIDGDAKTWKRLEQIMEKYGYYPVPYSYCDLNVYEL